MTDRTTLLVVNGDWLIANGLRAMLETAGFEVSVAHRADHAERLLRESPPSLVLVDAALDGGDGIEFAAMALGDGVRVIFTTVHSDVAILARIREAGASDVLTKPFSRRRLVESVCAALE